MEKLYIGIYGSVNSGKSSLINRLAGQEIAIVSEKEGTTTDPVKKLIELDGIGPCVLIDSAGINDSTELGAARIDKTMQTVDIIDMAIIVADAGILTEEDKNLITLFKEKNKPFFVINNKKDKGNYKTLTVEGTEVYEFSCTKDKDVKALLKAIQKYRPGYAVKKLVLLDDLIEKDDVIVSVTPIDSAAPEGRMILPQMNVIRNVLDNNAINVVVQVEQLAAFLKLPVKVKLVITDSQAFKEVSKIVPPEIPLTSFSIAFARMKGDFEYYVQSVRKIAKLKDGDKVLILESCSHSGISCEDIGRVKLPKMIREISGKTLDFKIITNLDPLPQDIASYGLVVQCGGCMVTKNQLQTRIQNIKEAGVPVTNYGVTIAYCTGILDRVTEIFKIPVEG